jgi:TolB-like protein/DNA-binding winged helix-turn-helix (wHTH) protein/Tfp pilus assembly protein PilF
MPAPTSPAVRVLRFESFELDLRAGELRKRGVKLRLQGQPIHLLGILAENAGTLVTRDELRHRLWPADTFVDFDHGLHNAIARIREILGDSVGTPRYIETLPRRGYRFIAPVEEVEPSSRAAARNGHNSADAVAITHAPRRRAGFVVMVCACSAIGLAAASFAWRRFPVEGAAPPVRSIAVLPLKNLSGDAREDYFADAMTEELITEMSRIQALKVISHTSVMEYKHTTKHLPQIARELGVDDVVEGSVTRDGNQVRITVQLLDAPNDRHLWSEDYQRPLHGILDLQNQIAQTIAQQIRVTLTADQRVRHGLRRTVDPEAYDAYLRGRYYLNSQYSTQTPVNTARKYFEQSIGKDPGFALAYAGLADAEWNLAGFRHVSAESAYRSVKEAARKALDLDEGVGEAHMMLALLSWRYEWDWKATERELAYAIAAAPSDDNIRCYHSNYLAWRGRLADALAEITKARELNPGSSFAVSESAIYFQLRDDAGLIRASQRGIDSDPNEWLEHYFLGMGYEGAGRRAEAIPEYEKAVQMSGRDQDATAALAHAYAMVGRKTEAEAILREFEGESDRYVSPYMIATIYAGLGDKARAFEFLTKAYRERCLDVVWQLKADHRVDNLRSDPQFQTLLRQVGFP